MQRDIENDLKILAEDDNLMLHPKGEFDFTDQNAINIVNKGPRRPLSPYIFFS